MKNKQSTLKELIHNIRRYCILIKTYRWISLLILCILFINSLLEGAGIGMLIPLIDNLTQATSNNMVIRVIYTGFAYLAIPRTNVSLLIVFFTIIIFKNILRYVQVVLYARLRRSLVFDISRKIYSNLMEVAYTYFHQTKNGDVLYFISSGACYAGHVLNYFIDLGFTLMVMGCYLTLLFMISVKLTLIALLLSLLSIIVFKKKISLLHTISKATAAANQDFNSSFIESIDGIKIVKAFANETYEQKKFEKKWYTYLDRLYRSQITVGLVDSIKSPLAIGMILVLVYLARTYFHLTFSSLSIFFVLLYRFIPYSQLILDKINMLSIALPPVIIAMDAISKENKPYLPKGMILKERFENSIRFENVSFAYLPEEYVLHDVSVEVAKNKTTAIIGATGAGKTTMIDLIIRLYDPTRGMITVDGIDLKTIDLPSWRKRFAIVLQDVFIFNDSVRNNILYGRLDADDDAVRTAARIANAEKFILSLPDGYETMLGDRGVTLSGGQKQMLALARALIREPDILILDEATSSLDNESERAIQQAIERLSGSKTIVVIAHRLSTILNADTIVVLEKGRVVEQGSHSELIRRKGRYEKFYNLQFAENT